jgi:hypothetical protein
MTSTRTSEHVSPLTAMLYPAYTERCEHCGGFVAISAEEALKRALEAVYQPWSALARAMQQQPSATAAVGLPTTPAASYGDWMTEWTRSWTGYEHPHECRPRRHPHHGHHPRGGHHPHHHGHHAGYDCRCEKCGREDCHCSCCVVDADLVVHTRLGERRLVPLVLENNRRRERQVKLELSDFSSRSTSWGAVTGRLLTDDEFTLDACEEREVLIGIQVGPERDQGGEGGTDVSGSKPSEGKAAAATEGRQKEGEKLPDVDECRVVYADLRIEGCDTRPIRIAVAILPRDCHDYRVDCDCSCCC